MTNDPPIRIYVGKIENRNIFQIKRGYYFEHLNPETMKLLGSTEKDTLDKNGESVSHSEITVLVHYNIVNNDYQHDSRVLYTFVSNSSFCQLLDISLKISIFLKSFNSEFSYIEV